MNGPTYYSNWTIFLTRKNSIGANAPTFSGFLRVTRIPISSTNVPTLVVQKTVFRHWLPLKGIGYTLIRVAKVHSSPTSRKSLHLQHPQTQNNRDDILHAMEPKVSSDMNCLLDSCYFVKEIKAGIFQMKPYIAPRLDGMPPFFFQRYWSIVGQDITCAIQSFLSSRKILRQIHYTLVSLILKVKRPKDVTQFRLISICNIFFKIASKVLVNRLKTFLV